MNRAVFLDRDGVVNKKGVSYYISREDDFELNEGVTDALKYFSLKGYLLIIITNQGGISKGRFTVSQLEKLHDRLRMLLLDEDIELTDIYYCPHHPDNEACNCRKPGTLLFEQAARKYNIDTGQSWMIGDSPTDIEAADKMGIRGILIPTNGNMLELIVNKGII
jgi:D-glycero-D-manno-heptose 1,7-bisphosphate phosphatase